MIHLDTSFLILGMVAGTPQDRSLREWLAARESLVMSAVAWGELRCGPLAPTQLALATRIIDERAPFTERHADLAAELFNTTGRRRGSFADCMIAAAALAAGAPIATANAVDFERFEASGLRVLRA